MLFDTASGHFERIGSAALLEALFSGDGRRAILLRPLDAVRASGSTPLRYEIVAADLTAAGASLHETSLTVNDRWPQLALSEDGRRVALIEGDLLSVYEVDTGRMLASVRVDLGPGKVGRREMRFVSPDRVRLYTFVPRLEIRELDLAGKRLELTGTLDLGMDFPTLQIFPDDRLFVHDVRAHGRALLVDGRTGAIVQSYETPGGGAAKFRRLMDGRVVAIDAAGPGRSIRILTTNGAQTSSALFAEQGWTALGGEVVPGKLVVAAGPPATGTPDPSGWKVFLVDADRGEVKETARGLLPIVSDRAGWLMLDSTRAGQPATRLFHGRGTLVFHDPLTGETKVLAGRAPA
jgi:hypothetical protein